LLCLLFNLKLLLRLLFDLLLRLLLDLTLLVKSILTPGSQLLLTLINFDLYLKSSLILIGVLFPSTLEVDQIGGTI